MILLPICIIYDLCGLVPEESTGTKIWAYRSQTVLCWYM